MRVLKIVASPRRERSASTAIIDVFLSEYKKKVTGLVVDTLDVWSASLPEFDAEAIGAKYKGVSGETMDPIGKRYVGKDQRTRVTLPKRGSHRPRRSDVELFVPL